MSERTGLRQRWQRVAPWGTARGSARAPRTLALAAGSAVALAAVVGLGWAASHHDAPAQGATVIPTSVAATQHLVVLGDSVATGSSCSCTPFPDLIGEYLTNQVGHHVDVKDDGVDGATSSDLLKSLAEDGDIHRDVTGADLVLVTIGANDIGELAERGPSSDEPCDAACYTPAAQKAATAVGDVVGKVHALTPNARIVVTDYWNVFTDGTEATDARERAYTRAVTDVFNAKLKPVVAASGATYVGLVPSFRGADGTSDPTDLLLDDGDHPNADGHERIAKAVLAGLGVEV